MKLELRFLASVLLVVGLAQPHLTAQTSRSVLVSPAAGATGVDFTQPIQWTAVPNAQAYYLYVGTTVGANNLVNTGEIQQTSFLAASLPANQTVYARIWTKVAGSWSYSDSTFSGDILTTRIVSPVNGATNADWTQPIQWTAVPHAQAYYLYVGTTVGTNNLINTGEIQQTSFPAVNLPANQTMYARIYVKVAGSWRYTDSTFSGDVLTTRIVSPVNGATNADWTQPIQWTAVGAAQAYYLYVGTTVGADDLINTGEIQRTSSPAMNLPANQTVYARIWTKVAGSWSYSDSTFSGDILTTRIVSPVNGATNADWTQPIQWTAVPHAQAYYLYVGTTVGTNNLINTGEIQQTSFPAVNLPANQTMYARIYVKVAGSWRYIDSTFSGGSFSAVMTSPANGSTAADLTQPIRWTMIPGAQAYYLYVGTTIGAKDLVDTGELSQTTYSARTVAAGHVVYARLWTKLANAWKYTDSSFTALPLKALLTSPPDGTLTVSSTLTFQWTTIPTVDAYYLYVGSAPGAKDLVNTGEIHVTSYVRANLPVGQTLYARIWTKIAGLWQYSDSTFAPVPSTRVLQASDMVYEGAFRVPDGDFGSPQFHGFQYGGTALTFNSAHGSLFMVGHTQDQLVAELSIPAVRTGPLSGLATASVLQNFFDPLEGHLNDINPTDPNSKLIGGLLPLADRMLISAYSYYDGLGTQVLSHFTRPLTLATSGDVQGPFQVGPLAGMVSGYMTAVPAGWQRAFGGSALTGNCCLGVISRTSYGPAVSAIDPAAVGITNPTPAVPLVQYPSAHTTLGAWDGESTNALFNGSTQVTGVVFPDNTSSVLFVGRRGVGVFCYGPGTADISIAGTLADGGVDRYCFDPADGSKGTHAYPYVYSIWAYNALSLAAVHAGASQPWDVLPYAVWDLALPYANGGGLLLGATYDATTNRIFLSQGFADGTLPVIHVFSIQP